MNTTDLFSGQWNAAAFFGHLTAVNRLAVSQGFTFCRVSGLEGFEEALAERLSAPALVCVSDTADGYTELHNSPRTRRVKTVFLAMRHAVDNMDARSVCMETMREVFRQFMSRLILEKTLLEQNSIFLDPRITFTEIDRYFCTGCACAYFQIAVDVFTDLRVSPTEWTDTQSALWVTAYPESARSWLMFRHRAINGTPLVDSKNTVSNPPFILVHDITSPDDVAEVIQQLDSYNVTYVILPGGQKP